jgi:hypothetical protein
MIKVNVTTAIGMTALKIDATRKKEILKQNTLTKCGISDMCL